MTKKADSLKKRLREQSPEVRRRAVMEVADLDNGGAVDILIEALGDDDWRVRKETITAASAIANPDEIIPRLIDAMLQEENVGLRNAASEALSLSGVEAITAIITRMPEFDVSGRKIAVEVLGASSDPRVVDVLVEELAHPDHNIRGTAAEWLGEQGGEKSTEALLKCLGEPDQLLVLAAIQSLNRINASIPWSYLKPLSTIKLYGDDLLFALGRSGAVEAVPIIVKEIAEGIVAARALELLHDASPETAAAVESALQGLGDEETDYLCNLTQDGDPAEQRSAVSCLLWTRPMSRLDVIVGLARNEALYPLILEEIGKWGSVALGALEQMMPDLDGRRLASVIGILARLLDFDAGRAKTNLFADYLASEDLVVATAAAGAVARFGESGDMDRLLELAGSDVARVRRVAGYALVELGRRHPNEMRKKLADIELEGPSGIQLCRVIEVIGIPENTQRLSAALSSPDAELRGAVLGTLAAVAGADAVDTIALSMTDEDRGVRMKAAAALGRIGPAAAETIVSALHSAEDPLKAALLRALGRVGHIEASVILRGMYGESAEVALAALEAMRELGLDAEEVRAEILAHEDSEVVKQALAALGSSVTVEQLVKLLAHSGWDVRLAAVDRLAAQKGMPAMRGALEAHLDVERDDLVRRAIQRVLGSGGE
ncbi:MAG: hypothetical protein GY854_10290 [Deltaproteobacteria bacterium]|nr:hypothetical protein [Deltaproteobacteria bacterium]